MRVGIVGGGIGGLAAACAFALRGADVTVYEQAPKMGEVGAGLQISANGWKVLEALGVADALWPAVFEPPTVEMRMGRSGRRVWSLPMGQVSRPRWGAPYVHVHRADLAAALAARLEALRPGSLVLGARLTGYGPGQPLRLEFGRGRVETCEVLIGADGLHSVVRAQMLGPGRPVYTGNVAWRCVVPLSELGADAPPANATIWAGAGRHAVTTRLRGGALVNFVGMVERPEPSEESWTLVGARPEAQADFDGWAPPIRRVLTCAPLLHRWALFSRPRLPRWVDGPAALIGDAAHPMLPSMAQGAVQALEDAWVVAAAFAEGDAGAYERARCDHASRVQAASAANARMFHRAGPLSTPIFYGGMGVVTRLFPGILTGRQAWVYGNDVVADHPL